MKPLPVLTPTCVSVGRKQVLDHSLVKLDDRRRDGQYGKPEPHADVAFNVGDEAWNLVRWERFRCKIHCHTHLNSSLQLVGIHACTV